MKIYNVQQRTEKWLAIKAGKFSASNFHRLITPTGKPSSQAEKYIYQVAGERILGYPEETHQNQWMARGSELEDEARKYYEFITGHKVRQVGFVELDEFVGCSPDGLIGEDGGLEIKCPALAAHVKYLLDDKMPSEYIPQVQGNMYITDREWWAFLSYYPGLEPLLLTVERNEGYIVKLKGELDKAIELLKEIVKEIGRVK